MACNRERRLSVTQATHFFDLSKAGVNNNN